MPPTETAAQDDFHHRLRSLLASVAPNAVSWGAKEINTDTLTDDRRPIFPFSSFFRKPTNLGQFKEPFQQAAPVKTTARLSSVPSGEDERTAFMKSTRARAAHCQATKEAVLCFKVLLEQRRVLSQPLSHPRGLCDLNERKPIPSYASKSSRQRAAMRISAKILRHGAEKESEIQHLLAALRTRGVQEVPISELARANLLLYLPEVPFRRWGGSAHYARGFTTPEDVVREVRRYWRRRREAESRARLKALEANDAEAFEADVGQRNRSAFESIMESTEAFMREIGLRLKSTTAALPSEGFTADVSGAQDEYQLMHPVEVVVHRQPSGLRATLMPHQMDGLRFLATLHANHINGILADEMGVGKTIQTIAFLLYLKEQAASRGSPSGLSDRPGLLFDPASSFFELRSPPHLVLAPLSVIREWREACAQFAPGSLRVGVYQKLKHPVREAAGCDLVLLPFHLARRARSGVCRVRWGYLIVDEAHKALAHPRTLTARSILRIPCAHRLVLTATPLNSDPRELWALLYFLNPSVFAEGGAFARVFDGPFEAARGLAAADRGLLVRRLHAILRPFLLRRTKRDVDATLRATSHTLRAPLTAVQVRLLALLRGERRTPCVRALEASKKSKKSKESARESTESAQVYGLTRGGVSESSAQRLCDHAFLLPFCPRVVGLCGAGGPAREAALALACSGKFLLLHLLFSRLFCARRKAVIFTHWLDAVELLAESLEARGWGAFVEVLSGETPEEDRQRRVRRFREAPDCLFFIISLKAGGCGINLQAAHMVILLDRDYTRTNEDQALARVFRIGQRFTVRALYLTTTDPAENRITSRAARKNTPRQSLIEDGNYQAEDAAAIRERTAVDARSTRGGAKEAGVSPRAPPFSSPPAGGTAAEMDAFTRLWELPLRFSTSAPADLSSLEGFFHPAFALADGLRFALSDAHWGLLREVVEGFDRLVLTEADLVDAGVLARMRRHLPPTSQADFEREWAATARENGPDDAEEDDGGGFSAFSAGPGEGGGRHEWAAFWCLLHEALRGPPLLQRALDTAIEEDARLHNLDYQRALKRTKMEKKERTIRLRSAADPPHSFWMDCNEKGITSEDEVLELYAEKKAAIRCTKAKREAQQSLSPPIAFLNESRKVTKRSSKSAARPSKRIRGGSPSKESLLSPRLPEDLQLEKRSASKASVGTRIKGPKGKRQSTLKGRGRLLIHPPKASGKKLCATRRAKKETTKMY